LELLLDAAAQFRTEAPRIRFLLVGEGAEKEKLTRLAAEQGLSNVIFMDQQARERIPALLAASDLCLVLLKDTPVFRTVIPTKMLEIMSCARPVVLAVHGQAAEILNAADAGIVIRPENLEDLIAAIKKLAGDAPLRSQYGANGRKYIERAMSRQATASEYIQVLSHLLSSTKQEAHRVARGSH
jgi:glycosyltransferase involved in cell wall biosynthesis